MTKLEFVNKFIFQLFFCRLTKWVDKDKITAWGIQFFIIPFTGWSSSYITIGKMRKIVLKQY